MTYEQFVRWFEFYKECPWGDARHKRNELAGAYRTFKELTLGKGRVSVSDFLIPDEDNRSGRSHSAPTTPEQFNSFLHKMTAMGKSIDSGRK